MFEVKQSYENNQVYIQVGRITRNIKTGIRKAYYYVGKDVLSYLDKKMKEKKDGRLYSSSRTVNSKKNGTIVTKKRIYSYRASKPGEIAYSKSPGTTGKLRKSRKYQVQGSDSLSISLNTPYAKYLEEGTARMAARPNLKLSVKENLEQAASHFEREIKRQLEKNG